VNAQSLIVDLFRLSKDIRYVAVYDNGQLSSQVASGLENTSSSESDKYEELIVNPTLLLLAKQRGDIDCGGCQYLLIRYGNFFEFVRFLKQGHLSVGIQPDANPIDIVRAINKFLAEKGE
jgi:hypothetical protein